MENSKVKTLFFAQYWGQTVLVDVTNSGTETLYPIERSNMYRIEESYLFLRTIDQLEDEEKITAAICLGCDKNHDWEEEKLWYGETWISDFSAYNYHRTCTTMEILVLSQYLRAIGILLPFTYIDENGKPQTLQPDEIVAKSWAKVQPSNDKYFK